MPRKVRVVISERQQEYLRRLTRTRACPREVADRASIILFAYDKHSNATIADRLGCPQRTVREWRTRWAGGFDRLVRAECLGSDAEFRLTLVETLMDNPTADPAVAQRLAQGLSATDDARGTAKTLEPAEALG